MQRDIRQIEGANLIEPAHEAPAGRVDGLGGGSILEKHRRWKREELLLGAGPRCGNQRRVLCSNSRTERAALDRPHSPRDLNTVKLHVQQWLGEA